MSNDRLGFEIHSSLADKLSKLQGPAGAGPLAEALEQSRLEAFGRPLAKPLLPLQEANHAPLAGSLDQARLEASSTLSALFKPGTIDKALPDLPSPLVPQSVIHGALVLGEGIASAAVITPINKVGMFAGHLSGHDFQQLKLPDQLEVDTSLVGKAGQAIGFLADFAVVDSTLKWAPGAVDKALSHDLWAR
jgi:hypothetical protein